MLNIGSAILNTKGKASAVYRDSRNVMRKKIPKGILGLPKNKNINLVIISLRMIITSINTIRIKLLSMETFLDNFIIRKAHNGNNNIFIPNVFIAKISFKMPKKTAKLRAHLNSKNRLEITMPINMRSGFTPNTLM
jgi:hypothetical protein